jgi:hypothetical protein
MIVLSTVRKWLVSALVPLAAAGCGGGSDLMPLTVGHSQLYKVQAGFESYVATVKVTRDLSVANTVGYELASNLGVSRLAWAGDTLVAERLVNTQFAPPLPLLYRTDETHDRVWKGRVTFVDHAAPSIDDLASGRKLAVASQSQKADDQITFRGNKIHCTRSTVQLDAAGYKIEITTWFSAGLGIVRQEQRTDGALLVKLDLLEEQEK